MTRTIARPDKIDLDSPGRRDYWVALEHDSLWGDYLIPLTVIVGPKARQGQGMVAFGSNHGNEYEGPVVIKNLLNEINTKDVVGRLILVPVLNPAAFRAGTRSSTLDDNVNLNRAFVDGAGERPGISGITHRVAKFVRDYIWPRVHVVIDLHSGGLGYQFAHVASFHPVDDPEQSRAIEDTARWFGTPLVMTYQNQTPGLLPSEAERLGKITVGTELGWGTAVDIDGVRWGRQGVLAAAIRHGQLKGKINPIDHHKNGTQRRVAMVSRECFTVAPFSGHYQPLLPCGSSVKKGQTVGLLHDFERVDEPGWEVKAGVTGVVIAQAYAAVVLAGTHILVTGVEEPWAV
jgi:N-alpha-acetyl-L-2,4-diaminobutyrate deacetylase